MFIPPWGDSCHCRIPLNEEWQLIPVSWIIHCYRSDVSNVNVTLPQQCGEFTQGGHVDSWGATNNGSLKKGESPAGVTDRQAGRQEEKLNV